MAVVLVQVVLGSIVGVDGDGDGDGDEEGGPAISAVGAAVVVTGGGRIVGVRPESVLVGAVVVSVDVLLVGVSAGEILLVRPKAEAIGFTSVGLAWVGVLRGTSLSCPYGCIAAAWQDVR